MIMRKRILYSMILAIVALVSFSCQRDSLEGIDVEVPEGYVSLRFGVAIPDMTQVATRGVDPGGANIQSMKLFCFNEYGIFISVVTADVTPGGTDTEGVATKGTFKANVPDYTRIIHLVANQNLDNFNEADVQGMLEGELLATLVASSSKMVYWGRVACADTDKTIADAVTRVQGENGGSLKLVRDQARVKVNASGVEGQGEQMIVTGFYVCNTSAFGTVAPYNTEEQKFDWFEGGKGQYVTLPKEPGRMSDPADVVDQEVQYVFECENLLTDPVNVIIKARRPGQAEGAELYYRVLLLDENSEALPIIRNHSYTINIQGTLSEGVESFEMAMTSPATNNYWISVSDDIHSVNDNVHELWVEKTFVVQENKGITPVSLTLNYTYTSMTGAALTPDDEPEFSWVYNNQLAPALFQNHTFDPNTGKGSVTISVLALGDDTKHDGKLLIKKGRLQRSITIVAVKEFQFIPAWVSTEIYADKADQMVTLMFTIPEETPEELFPMNVLITTDYLDVRAASGMQLETLTKETADEEGVYYGDPTEAGYKYIYPVEEPGIQRLYLKTTLNAQPEESGAVIMEAPYFAKLTKPYTYNSQMSEIRVVGLGEYIGTTDDEFANDQPVYYRLVPQKRNARVDFTIEHWVKGENENDYTVAEFAKEDEFLLYSQYLDAYADTELPDGMTTTDCEFDVVNEEDWSTGGRVVLFRPRTTTTDYHDLTIYMKTNTSKSQEVVRIASNQATAEVDYTGNTYKSITFELANYNPFQFSPALRGKEDKEQSWDYAFETPVNLEIDVTSFRGADGRSADPFGEEFEIYIDAPMLEIAPNSTIPAEKFYEESPGRFVYKVEASREAERTASAGFGAVAAKKDSKLPDVAETNQDPEPDQSNERKILPFRIKEIVSAGTITISSNEEKVVFTEETFTIKNNPITGSIQYKDRMTGLQNVPNGAFVSFERTNDGTSIGSMDISNGRYSLRLRKEYVFTWRDDKIEIHYRDAKGDLYHGTLESIASLFDDPDNRNIVLEYEKETKLQ